MKRKLLTAIFTAVLLICAFALSACNGDTPDPNGGDTTLAKVTGFSYDNTGFWKFNEVTGAETYLIFIEGASTGAEPLYALTVQQSQAESGKFKIGTGNIPVGNHTAYIIAKAAGKTDSALVSCTANVTQAGVEVQLTIQNAIYADGTKMVSWDKVENATAYGVELRTGLGGYSGIGEYIAVPAAQIKTVGNKVQAVINYDLVKQAFDSAGKYSDLSGGLQFRITATGKTEGLTTYLDAEYTINGAYTIQRLQTPSVNFEPTENWYTRKVFFNKILNATGYDVTVDGKTLAELDITLTDTGTRMEFLYSIDPNGETNGRMMTVIAISETDGIRNVIFASSNVGGTPIGFVRPADAATYEDVKTALMPKITAAMYSYINDSGYNVDPDTIVFRGINLKNGRVYWEFVSPRNNNSVRTEQGDISHWSSLSLQKYEDIITHLSNSNNNIIDTKGVVLDTTWETVLADLGDDYWGGENLYAYKVIDPLMPKILSCLKSNMPSFDRPETLTLLGFNLTDGKVYFEYVNPAGVTRIAQGDIWKWDNLVPQKYEDIITHLSNSNNDVGGFSQYAAGTTWETVRAELTDYYSVYNLSGYLAAQG